MDMTEQTKAFLRIEKMIKGKIEGYEQWEEIPLNTDAMLIARPSNEPDAIAPDIRVIGDDYVSRRPIEIHYSIGERCFMLCDQGTTNGTFLNDELIENDGRLYKLKDYDVIGLAKVKGEMRVLLRFRTSHKTQPGWLEEEPGKPPKRQGLSVRPEARRVFVNGREVPLTRTEWKVLEVLYIKRNKTATVDDITWEVWGPEGALPELVAKYIQRLRDKIEPDRAKPQYIITNPAGGYILES